MRRALALAAALAWLLLPAGVALAQTQTESSLEQDAKARRISGQLMSPFCPGRTLNECPSPSATEWREDIREWVGEGVPAPEIRRRLEERAPEADLTGDPGAGSAISPLLWIALVALAIPAAILLPLARKRRRDDTTTSKAEPADDGTHPRDELDARLDEELEAYDG